MSNTRKPKLLDEIRYVMRLHHYSIHIERTYCSWIKRFVLFHKMASREDLKNGEAKIEKFLTVFKESKYETLMPKFGTKGHENITYNDI